ncbi:MAG: hypothetical protein HKM95_02185, partial [Inquilinus sp.]|nr:hypothetical protein [Inquilinus sp.]
MTGSGPSGRPWADRVRTLAVAPASLRVLVPAFLMLAFGIALIADTYGIFNATTDEPAHIAAGMEFLDRGEYTLERLHPPLARLAVALGPYADGVRSAGRGDVWSEGRHLLYEQGSYWRTLTLARLGTLPFFILAAALTAIWARGFGGPVAGLAAFAFFVTTPALLAHGGLATTDMAFSSLFLAAVLAGIRWLQEGRASSALLLGLSAGLAFMAKFSAGPFLLVGFAILVLVRWRIQRRHWTPMSLLEPRRRSQLAAAALVVLATVWAVHGFRWSEVPLRSDLTEALAEAGAPVDGAAAESAVRTMVVPMFLSTVPDGLLAVLGYNAVGKETFFFGEWRTQGHPLFYPVTLAVKTPVPLLILGLAGLGLLFRQGIRDRDWRPAAPAVFFSSVFVIAAASNLNYGVRHILPVIPLLCVGAGYGIARLWSTRHGVKRMAGVGLAAWQLMTPLAAHPDHLAYFNALAGSRPERVLILGDLDWGQDLERLAHVLDRLGVESFHLLYLGSA